MSKAQKHVKRKAERVRVRGKPYSNVEPRWACSKCIRTGLVIPKDEKCFGCGSKIKVLD